MNKNINRCKKCGRLVGKKLHTCPTSAWNKGKHIYLGGGFKKGHKTWNKGLKGRQNWHNTSGLEKGHGWNKGIPMSEATKKKLSIANKGKIISVEARRKISEANKGHIGYMLGKKHSEATRKLMSETHKKNRKKCHLWKGGITKLYASIRNSFQYRQYRKKVFERDNYTCQECGQIGGKLHAHHKKSFSKIMKENNITTYKQAMNCDKLWDIKNGITFCFTCHKETDTYLRNQPAVPAGGGQVGAGIELAPTQ